MGVRPRFGSRAVALALLLPAVFLFVMNTAFYIVLWLTVKRYL